MQKPPVTTKLGSLHSDLRNLIKESIKEAETLKSALNGLYNLYHVKIIKLDNTTANAIIDELVNKFSPEFLNRMEKSGKGLCSSFDLYHEIIKHAIDLKLYELYPALIHKITKDKFNSREIFDSLDVIARSIIENKQESFYPEIHKIFEYFMPFNQGPTGQSFYSLIMLIISKKVKPLYPLVKKYLPILRSDYNIPIITLIIQEKLSSLYWVLRIYTKKRFG